MGDPTLPAFLEKKLKEEYKGKDPSIPYKIMNSIGAMSGPNETAKGREMEAKHAKDMSRESGRGRKGKM